MPATLVDHLRRAIRDQDDLDWLCGPDPAPPRPRNAPPLTARELVTSAQPPSAPPLAGFALTAP